MRRTLTLFVAAALLPAAPALAGDKKPKDPNEIICKRERFVGSHRTTKICRTRFEWDNARTDSHELLDSKTLRVVRQLPGG